jgi:hypothetical protein
MDALLRQITAIRTNAFLEPDAIVLTRRCGRRSSSRRRPGTGNYFAGGPFVDPANQTLWGKKVVTHDARSPSATALVGAFAQGGQIFRKGGLTVEASNSHATSSREPGRDPCRGALALAVYRPGAFGTVTNL